MLTRQFCTSLLVTIAVSGAVETPRCVTAQESSLDAPAPTAAAETAGGEVTSAGQQEIQLTGGCQCSPCPEGYGPECSSGQYPRRLRRQCRSRWHSCRDRWQIDYARPYGDAVRSINQAQVSRGDAAQMVLYDFDFRDGESVLNLAGLRRLSRIAQMLPTNYYPIIIEGVDNNPALAAARREEVLNVLHSDSTCFPVPDERVVVADPPAHGLDGLDAVITHEKQLGLTTYGIGPATSGFETADVPVIAPVVVGPTQ